MSHTAEIIAVGTELLLGGAVNTNAAEISRALTAVGVETRWHTVVGDDPERLRAALDIARRRADILVTTGGLGPTYDDLTKQTVCAAFGKPLVLREEVLERIRTYFARNVHLTMPENNRQQAEFPADCVIFDNPVGTAPGCAFEAEGVYVLMLPGPPFEMRTMLQNWAVPYLRGLSEEVIVSHDIMTFGLGESPMEDLMRERISRMENPTLATYAKPSEVRLRATAKADSAEAAETMLTPVVKEVAEYLGDAVYGVDVPDLETVCMTHLKEKGWTFATAESCTGGQIAARITALPEASGVYRGGVVSYWSSVKAEVLGVPQALLERYGAVSEECARSMAENARRITGADIGLSVTGVAGPDPDERNNPVGLVYVGLASPDGTWCRKLELGQRRRDRIQDLAANHAYDMLRRCLTGLPVEQSGTGKRMEKL